MKETREINLIDLFFNLLLEWRRILLVASAGAVLVGGFKGVSLYTAYKEELSNDNVTNNIEIYTTAVNEKETELESAISRVRGLESIISGAKSNIYRVQRDVEYRSDYIEKSILMNIDSYEKPQLIKHLKITLVQDKNVVQQLYRDPADEILSAYIDDVMDIVDLSDLVNKYDSTENYIRELITVEGDLISNTIIIRTTGIDQSMAENIMNSVTEKLEERRVDIQKHYQAHELEELNVIDESIVDRELLDFQISNLDELVNLQLDINNKKSDLEYLEKELETAKENLEAVQKAYDDLLEVPESVNVVATFSKGVVIKYVIIGFVLFAMLFIIVYALKYIFSDRIHTINDVYMFNNLQLLAVLSRPSDDQRNLFLDRLIRKLTPRDLEIAEKNAIELISATIEKNTKAEDIIALVGNVECGKMDKYKSALQNAVSDREVKVGYSIFDSSESFNVVQESDKIILVEERRKSRISDLRKEISIAESLGKEIMGIVIL